MAPPMPPDLATSKQPHVAPAYCSCAHQSQCQDYQQIEADPYARGAPEGAARRQHSKGELEAELLHFNQGKKCVRNGSVLMLATTGNDFLFRTRNGHRLRAEPNSFTVFLVRVLGSAAAASEAYHRFRANLLQSSPKPFSKVHRGSESCSG
jgi:hypothetical protein